VLRSHEANIGESTLQTPSASSAPANSSHYNSLFAADEKQSGDKNEDKKVSLLRACPAIFVLIIIGEISCASNSQDRHQRH